MGRLAVAVIVSLWVIPISILVNRIVPEPYMDEIFHIPQAQEYCKGNFLSWDPMITTPPGLYLISLAHVVCLSPLVYFKRGMLSLLEVCSPPVLRSLNGVLAVLCSVVVYEIICHLRPVCGRGNATVAAIVLALYPLHWFFTFLYYTDVASLTAVLAMYLACLKKKYYLSASMGSVAVFFRQTNIVWMLFVACIGVLDKTLAHQKGNVKEGVSMMSDEKPSQLMPNMHVTMDSNVRRRKLNNVNSTHNFPISMSASSRANSSGFLTEIQTVCLRSWQMKWDLIFSFIPFLLVLVAFVGFVCWNGSIVLGAKEAHAVSPHIAQLMYFSLVTALMMGPLHFSFGPASDMLKSLWTNRPLSFCYLLVALTTGILSVHYFSIAHPYLLADNRHYTFYLWRKVIKAHWLMRYLLVPLYVYSWFSIINILRKVQNKTCVLAYFLTTAAVLIPAPLIEFRYYTIPFFFLALHSPVSDKKSWVLIGISYVAINVFTMMMFLFRPFQWNLEPGIQRFIW